MTMHTHSTSSRLLAVALAVGLAALGFASASSAQGSDSTRDPDVDALRSRLAETERELDALMRQLAELRDDQDPVVWPTPRIVGTRARARIGITLDTRPRPANEVEGAIVEEVVPDGPAERAGVRPGDEIVGWNGTELRPRERDFFGRVSYDDHLLDLARRLDPGDEVELEIVRDGERVKLTVAAEEAPAITAQTLFGQVTPRPELDAAARALEGARIQGQSLVAPRTLRPRWNTVWGFGGALWGDVELVPLDAELGEYFDTDRGLLVLKTPEDDAFGLRAGDVVLSIGEREPRDATHALRILRSYDQGEQVNLYVVRKGERVTLTAEVPASDPAGPFGILAPTGTLAHPASRSLAFGRSAL